MRLSRSPARVRGGDAFERRLFLLILILPSFVYLCILLIYPMGRAIFISLFRADTFVGAQNYLRAAGDPYFLPDLAHTLFWCTTVVVAHNVIGMAFAVLLNRELPLRNLLRGLVYLPWLLPPVVVAVLWKSFYLPVQGPLNTALRALGLDAFALDWLGTPILALPAVAIGEYWAWYAFFTTMYLAGMQGIPDSLYEAARIDGASPRQEFRYITLPLLKPLILTTSLVQFIWNFRFFDMVWIMTRGGPAKASEVLATEIYKTAFFGFDFNEAAALGVIMAGMMSVFVVLYVRFSRSEGGS